MCLSLVLTGLSLQGLYHLLVSFFVKKTGFRYHKSCNLIILLSLYLFLWLLSNFLQEILIFVCKCNHCLYERSQSSNKGSRFKETHGTNNNISGNVNA